MDFEFTKALFSKKEPIKVLGGVYYTNTVVANNHKTYSKFSGAGRSTPAKLNGICHFLDKVFVEKSLAVRQMMDGVYVEFGVGKDKCHAWCSGDAIQYIKGEMPKGLYDRIIPFIVYNMMGDRTPQQEEFVDAWLEIVNQINGSGVADIISVAKMCDSFYYGIAKDADGTVEIKDSVDSDRLEDLLLAAKDSGDVFPMASFVGVKMPSIDILDNTDNLASSDETKSSDIWADCKDGKMVVPYDWDDKAAIPSITTLDEYVKNSQFENTVTRIHKRLTKCLSRMDAGKVGTAAIARDYINFFITGKPGTGKTTLAYALGAALGMPVYSIAITKNTEEDTFQGMTKVVDGKLQFVSTDFLNAYENGGIIVLEEINLADPAVIMGAIGQAVEFPFILKKNGSETIHRHPLTVVIGTMNVGTFGSKGVNQALSSRFKQTYTLDDPTKEDFVKILQSAGNADKKLAEWIHKAYESIISTLMGREYNAEDLCINVTLRGCLGAIEAIEDGSAPKDAIRDTLIGKIAENDLEIAKKIYEDVVLNLPDYRGKITK